MADFPHWEHTFYWDKSISFKYNKNNDAIDVNEEGFCDNLEFTLNTNKIRAALVTYI